MLRFDVESDAGIGAGGGSSRTVADRAACPPASEPELKGMVLEATRALAGLDVDRLHELALSCEALTKMPPATTLEDREELARQARAASGDMAVFARVLDATRANVKVMERLRELRMGKATYSARILDAHGWDRKAPEGDDGND